jgi:hypothetical protein
MMRRVVIAAAAVSVVLIVVQTTASAQAPTIGDAQSLRDEIRQVETQISELTARLRVLKERLARAEPQRSGRPAALLFPVEIERAMLQDGLAPRRATKRDGGNFDRQPKEALPLQPRR